jgi:hypothetical protein
VLKTGIRSLSVPAALVPDVKNAIRLQTLEGISSQDVKYKDITSIST